jgi:hypothetical protein
MPRYPRRATEYYAILEGVQPAAEMDCGCLIQENEHTDAIEL